MTMTKTRNKATQKAKQRAGLAAEREAAWTAAGNKKRKKRKSTTPQKFRHNSSQEGRGLSVAFFNKKGGTAKTLQAAILAFEAAKKGLRVVVLDLDHQCNLTTRMGYEPYSPMDGSICTALHNHRGDWRPEDVHGAQYSIEIELLAKPIQIIPGDSRIGLDLAALDKLSATEPDVVHRLRKVVDCLRPYADLIIIDAPPTGDSMLVDLILWAVDVVAIPMDGWDAVDGACHLLDRIRVKQIEREALDFRPIQTFLTVPHLTSNYTQTPPWLQFAERQFGEYLVRDYVRHSIQAQRASIPGKILANISGNVRKDYRRMLSTLFRKVFDSTLPGVLDHWQAVGLSPAFVRDEAIAYRRKQGRNIHIVPVKSAPLPQGTDLNPPVVGEVMAEISRNGGFS